MAPLMLSGGGFAAANANLEETKTSKRIEKNEKSNTNGWSHQSRDNQPEERSRSHNTLPRSTNVHPV